MADGASNERPVRVAAMPGFVRCRQQVVVKDAVREEKADGKVKSDLHCVTEAKSVLEDLNECLLLLKICTSTASVQDCCDMERLKRSSDQI